MSDDDKPPPVFELAAKFIERTQGYKPEDVFLAAVLLARYATVLGQQPQCKELDDYLVEQFHLAPIDVIVTDVPCPPRVVSKRHMS